MKGVSEEFKKEFMKVVNDNNKNNCPFCNTEYKIRQSELDKSKEEISKLKEKLKNRPTVYINLWD